MLGDGQLQIDRNITQVTPNLKILNYITRIFSMKEPSISTFTYDQQLSLNFLQSKPVNQYLIGSAIIFDFQESLSQSLDNPTITEILRKLISLGYFVPQIYSNPNFIKELMKNFNILKDFLLNNLSYQYLNECSFAIGFLLSSISTYFLSLDFGEKFEQFLSDILQIYLLPNLLDDTSIPLFLDFFIVAFQNFSISKEFNDKEFSLFLQLMKIIISTITMDITYNFDYLFLVAKLLLFISCGKMPITTRIEAFKFIISISSKYEEVSLRLIDPINLNSIICFIYDFLNTIPFNVTLNKAPPPILMTKFLSIESITPITSPIIEPFFKDEPYKPLDISNIIVSATLKLPKGPKQLENNKDAAVLITTISNLCHSIQCRDYYINQIECINMFIKHPMFNEYPIAPFFLSFWVLRILTSENKKQFLSDYFHQIDFFSKMLIISYDKFENEYLRKLITDIIIHLSDACEKSDDIINDLLKFFLKKVKMVQLDDILTNCVAVLANFKDEIFVKICQEINFAQSLSSCLIMHQKIDTKINDEERLIKIKKNRQILLNFIEKISFVNSVFTYLCSKENYYIVIMSHFYDVSTADFALAQIKRAISIFNANYPFTRYIFKFFATKLFKAYDSKSFPVSIMEKIIDFCIEGFIVHPLPIGQIFSESNFLESLVKFSIEIEATDCIERLLDLMNHISSSQCDYTPNIAIFLKLSPLIKSRKNMSLADFLLKIAFGDDNKMNSARKIVNHGPLPLLLQVYKDDDEKLSEYLAFIQKCLVFSMFEIVRTNMASQLILYLSEYRKRKSKDKIFDQALSFLKEIMSYSISPQDLRSYFQLLTVIPDRYRPFYTIDLLDTLIHVFKNQTISALTFFSINELSRGIDIPLISTDVFNNNFSLIIRIFIIERNGTIFHLSNKNEFLTLSFDKESLILNGKQLGETLPKSQWFTFYFNHYKHGNYQILVNDKILINDTIPINDQELSNKEKIFKVKNNFTYNIIALQLKSNIEFIRIEANKSSIYNFNAYSFCQKYAVDKNEVAEVDGSIIRLQQPPKVVLNAIGGVSTFIPLFAQLDLLTSDEKAANTNQNNSSKRIAGSNADLNATEIKDGRNSENNNNLDNKENHANNESINLNSTIQENIDNNESITNHADDLNNENSNNQECINNDSENLIHNENDNTQTDKIYRNENDNNNNDDDFNAEKENNNNNNFNNDEANKSNSDNDKNLDDNETDNELSITDSINSIEKYNIDNDELSISIETKSSDIINNDIDDDYESYINESRIEISEEIPESKKSSNGKAHLLITILTLIEEALRNSPQLQSDFCSEEGFRMIGELLSITTVDTFTKEVILKLFHVFMTLTDRKLRKQMIEYVFFNMTTWLYVVDLHEFYFNRLFGMMIDLVKRDSFYESILNVKGVLLIMRCYLYSKYDESFCLLKKPKLAIDGKIIAERPIYLKKLRSMFLNFIIVLSNITFTQDDFIMIVYFCFDSSDVFFQSLIITLLARMIAKRNKTILGLLSQGASEYFYKLFKLLQFPNIILSNAVMALFSSLVSTGILKFSENQIKSRILKTVLPQNLNNDHFNKLNISSSSYSFKIPLLLYILSALRDIKVVEKDFMDLLSKSKVIEDFENNEHFYYIFLMHCFLDSKYKEIILKLMESVSVLCFKKSEPFSKILNFTEFIEFHSSKDLSPFLREFFLISLDKLNNEYITNLSTNQISSIISTLYLFIFRIPSFDTYSNFTFEMKQLILPKLTFIDIFQIMNKSPTVTINYSFSMRSTIDNDWLDWEIAIKAIDTILSQSSKSFIDEYSMFVGSGIQYKKYSKSFITKSQKLLEIFKTQDFGLQSIRDSFVVYLGCISRFYFQNESNSNIQRKLYSLITLIFQSFQAQIYSIIKMKPTKNASSTNDISMLYETLPHYIEKLQKIEKNISKKLSEDVKIDMSHIVSDDSVFNNLPKINIPKKLIKEKIILFSTFLKKSSRQSMKKYKQLFQSLSSDNGPWTTPENPSIIHYKLDINSTKRTRLIPNMKFSLHREASLARDLGSFKDAKAIMKEQIAKMKLESFAGDFSLIEFDDQDDEQNELNKKNVNANIDVDKVIIKCQSYLITPKKVHKGYLNLMKETIIFDSDSKLIKLNLGKVKKILLRRYLMEDTAVEIFATFSRAYFVNFQNESERLLFLNKVASLKVPTIKYIQRKSEDVKKMAQKVTEKWQRGEISNFKYLMKLNVIAGRSFNDLSQYPVFPWILSDYKSDTIDLSDPSVYRDLSVPIAAHGEQRLKWMREKMDESVSEDTHYLFGAFYSSSAVVIGYLIRMEPFTSLHIQLQSGRFDITDRLFVSIPASWDSVTSAQMDFRELIPEFFLIPDFLNNVNQFDLGKTAGNEVVGDVKLPPWAKTPREFIEINKKALESPIVSNNLHKWVDIIFGPHSRMPLSDEVNNVFHPYFYETSLARAKIASGAESEIMVKLIKEYAACFGICPLQIFDKFPEPKKCSTIARQISAKDDNGKTILFNDNSKVIYSACDEDTIISITQDLQFATAKIIDDSPTLPIASKGKFAVKIPPKLMAVTPIVAASKNFAIVTVPWSTDFSIFSIGKQSSTTIAMSSQPISALATSAHYIAAASNDCTLRTWLLKENGIDDNVSPSLTSKDDNFMINYLSSSQNMANQKRSSNNNSSIKMAQSLSKLNVLLRPIGFLAKHGQPIVFIEISERLNLVFSISRDGFVSCISLSDGRYLHGIELEMSEPSLFAVSKSGYVCVAFNGPDSSVVIILDQNLEKISTAHFDSTIVCWTPCDKIGIDFMAVVLKTKNLSILELPKLDSPLCNRNLKMKIKTITFSRKITSKLFLGTENGKVIVFDLM